MEKAAGNAIVMLDNGWEWDKAMEGRRKREAAIRKRKEAITHSINKVAVWLSKCPLKVCMNALCKGARCHKVSHSLPRSPPPPTKCARRVLSVELNENEEQEVIIDMDYKEIFTVAQQEDKTSSDEGSPGPASTVILTHEKMFDVLQQEDKGSSGPASTIIMTNNNLIK